MRALQGRTTVPSASRCSSSRPHALRHALAPVPRHLVSRQLHCAAAAEEAAGTNGAAGLPGAGVDFEELSDIIRMMNDTDIIEFELSSKKFNLSLRKKEALIMEQQREQMQFAPAASGFAVMPPPQAPAPAPIPPPAAAAAPTPAPAPVTPGPQKIEGIEITSPMSGTFYTTPAPGEPPFCKEGDKVTKGQTVGIIEAMKLMNEIEAEISGTVVKVLADNGTPVAPGMALLLIKP